MDIAFPSAPVKAKLVSDIDNPLAFFRKALADDLPQDFMYATAFVLSARLLLATKPGALAGYPNVIYAMIEMDLAEMAREVLPAERADEAVKMIEATS